MKPPMQKRLDAIETTLRARNEQGPTGVAALYESIDRGTICTVDGREWGVDLCMGKRSARGKRGQARPLEERRGYSRSAHGRLRSRISGGPCARVGQGMKSTLMKRLEAVGAWSAHSHHRPRNAEA
jgi:hypothetical protein